MTPGFFVPLYFFVVKSHVKIGLFVIQLENNRIYLSIGYFVVLAVPSNGQNNPTVTYFRKLHNYSEIYFSRYIIYFLAIHILFESECMSWFLLGI